ncbi:MAG TPA: helical backbone metal receptor [candidate division Zixibacteria bacterium]|nr:helical backbone metal receptor [candidate division Zixibacteria bacterium]
MRQRRRKRRVYSYRNGRRRSAAKIWTAAASLAAVIAIGAYVLMRFVAVATNDLQANALAKSPQRVVSLAPSITELVYTLGADSVLVGVTRYCVYPPAADTLPEVGGYLDVNLEALLALEPELVITLVEHGELQEQLRKLNVEYLAVNHQTVAGILESFTQVGARLAPERGDSLARAQKELIAQIRGLTESASRPTVLLAIGHSDQPGVIRDVYAAAREGFYSEVIDICGGENVVTEERIRYPVFSAEGVAALNPDYIIDIFPGGEPIDRGFVLEQWRALSDVAAVRNNRIVILQGQEFVIPGPRFIGMLSETLAALHPELAPELSESR